MTDIIPKQYSDRQSDDFDSQILYIVLYGFLSFKRITNYPLIFDQKLNCRKSKLVLLKRKALAHL